MALYGTHPEHAATDEHADEQRDDATPPDRDEPADASAVAVEADARVRVPRGEMGDLPAGVTGVLAGVDGATVVDVGEIDLIRPGSLDIYVDVTARLEGSFGDRDADAMADHVADTFGVEAVHAVAVEYAPDSRDDAPDYG